MAGKGSRQRPKQISQEEFDKNWQRAFGLKFRMNRAHKKWYIDIDNDGQEISLDITKEE